MTKGGFRIGRLFGITIRVDWSWLLIFLLVTWNLATSMTQIHPEWGGVMQWGLAIVAALLFFASVLAHELAHSLVSRARGMPVRDITLFLFGGVSNIQREPDSPGSEFLMTIVGPLSSLVIGGILVLITSATAGLTPSAFTNTTMALQQLNPLTMIFMWLGSINVILGLFNMIPGFPLDGGRVLRSILWAWTGNLRRATRWAAWVGQAISWLMITAGIAMSFGAQIPFFGTGLGSGLWLAFIGWFLNTASFQSYQSLVIHDLLEGVPVSRMMRLNPPLIAPGVPVSRLIDDHIMQSDDQTFPVMDQENHLLGLVTLDDIRSVAPERRESLTVREIMTPAERLITVGPNDDASAALEKLAQNDVRQLPVLDGDRLVGLLRRRDIVKWLQLHAESAR